MIFSGKDCYQANRILIALTDHQIVGFACFRHRIRDKITSLYFLGVQPAYQNRGIARDLLKKLLSIAKVGIELKVMKDNPAIGFYERLGYCTIGEAYEGKGWLMQKRKKERAAKDSSPYGP